MWSKDHQAEEGEIRIQMKRRATHRTCDDEEWIEGRSKEIATIKMERPTDMSAAQIFTGLVKYLS